MIDSCQDVHEHAVVWALIEIRLVYAMVLVKNFTNRLEDLGHQLMLVEAEHLQDNNNKFDEAINVSKVKSISWPLLSTVVAEEQSLFNACLDHNFAQVKKQLRVLIDSHVSELSEKGVDLLLLVFFVVNE